MIVLKFVAIAVVGYLLGSIPFGLIIGKFIGGVDVTKSGSGRIGVTNVLRTVGKRAAALAMVWDLGKGALAVALATRIIWDSVVTIGGFELHYQIAQVVAALAVMVGHNWSVFLRFHGGRGVSVFLGSLLAINPAVMLLGGEILLIVVLRTRYMSLGSILGSMGIFVCYSVLVVLYDFPAVYLVYALLATGLIIYQHRDNIARLQAGTERRIGFKADRNAK